MSVVLDKSAKLHMQLVDHLTADPGVASLNPSSVEIDHESISIAINPLYTE